MNPYRQQTECSDQHHHNRKQRGQGYVEYIIIVAAVGLAVFVLVNLMEPQIAALFEKFVGESNMAPPSLAGFTPPPTYTPTNTPDPNATATPTLTPTATATNTVEPTATNTAVPTTTATNTATPEPTNTPVFAYCEYAEVGSSIVIEAEHYVQQAQAGSDIWQETVGYSGYQGEAAMAAIPDDGDSYGSSTSGPRLDYLVRITNPGTYYVYVRGLADSANTGSNDSLHVGVNGTAVTNASGTGLTGFGNSFEWQNRWDSNQTVLTFNQPGTYTINAWMREDGFVFDRLWITQDGNAVSSGSSSNGPAESSAPAGCKTYTPPTATPTATPIPCYDLNISQNPANSGSVSVSPAPNCGSQYQEGTSITLNASPNTGYDFLNWSGAINSTSNPAALTVSSNTAVTANFETTCTLPNGWQNSDIGNVAATGSACESNGTFTVKGSGDDIWGGDDEFHYLYQQYTGDFSIIARITSQTDTNSWAKAGVMIRETLGNESKHATAALTPGNGVQMQYRTSTNGSSGGAGGTSGSAPIWLKLERSGDTFTSYTSSDGSNWSQFATTTITMNSTVYYGLAVTSHNDGNLSTATFTDVSVVSGGPPKVLLVVGNSGNLTSGENKIYNRLAALYDVVVVDDGAVSSSSDDNVDLVFISYEANAGSVGTTFRNSPVPVVVSEYELFDDMNMAAGIGRDGSEVDLNIIGTGHPMAAGYSGMTQVGNANGRFNYATNLGSGAVAIATIDDNSSQYPIFAYDIGAALTSGNATARRVGFYFENDNAANNAGTAGWNLFDAAIDWALNGGGTQPAAINFSNYTFSGYGGQDVNATMAIQNGGHTLQITDNGWKKIEFPYTVTANTVLEFDFTSSSEGEIHGIGFDTDDNLSSNTIFQLYGTQNWAISNTNNYAGETPKHYVIPVGDYFTGAFTYLIFVNDQDSGSGAESIFSNVRIYEAP